MIEPSPHASCLVSCPPTTGTASNEWDTAQHTGLHLVPRSRHVTADGKSSRQYTWCSITNGPTESTDYSTVTDYSTLHSTVFWGVANSYYLALQCIKCLCETNKWAVSRSVYPSPRRARSVRHPVELSPSPRRAQRPSPRPSSSVRHPVEFESSVRHPVELSPSPRRVRASSSVVSPVSVTPGTRSFPVPDASPV